MKQNNAPVINFQVDSPVNAELLLSKVKAMIASAPERKTEEPINMEHKDTDAANMEYKVIYH